MKHIARDFWPTLNEARGIVSRLQDEQLTVRGVLASARLRQHEIVARRAAEELQSLDDALELAQIRYERLMRRAEELT